MREKTIEGILGDFKPTASGNRSSLTGGTVTIWLSAEDKARYDRLQKMSGRKFSNKTREVLLAVMELAEQRMSQEA